MSTGTFRKSLLFRVIALTVLTAFAGLLPAQPTMAQVAFLPSVGSMVDMTAKFDPMVVRGIKLYPDNPFKFDFIVDTGDADLSRQQIKDQGQKLAEYFLASLTTPEKEMWVNLSPYEHSRIIPKVFGETEMGKELLAQDYMLKQIMATALYPERQLGQEFWQAVYAKAKEQFGTTNVPVNTFNKVWIVPSEAVVYENASMNAVFVLKSRLKVMLEQDYLAANKHKAIEQFGMNEASLDKNNDAVSAMSSKVIKQIVIPALEKEVNEGRNFAGLRQVYSSLILAAWYKHNLRDNVIARGYVDRRKILGIEAQDKQITEKIYQQYLKAYRKGVYNYVKEETDLSTNQVIPRKYFSGGFDGTKFFQQAMIAATPKQIADGVRSFTNRVMSGRVLRIGTLLIALTGISLSAQAATQHSPEIGNTGPLAALNQVPGHNRDTVGDYHEMVNSGQVQLESIKTGQTKSLVGVPDNRIPGGYRLLVNDNSLPVAQAVPAPLLAQPAPLTTAHVNGAAALAEAEKLDREMVVDYGKLNPQIKDQYTHYVIDSQLAISTYQIVPTNTDQFLASIRENSRIIRAALNGSNLPIVNNVPMVSLPPAGQPVGQQAVVSDPTALHRQVYAAIQQLRDHNKFGNNFRRMFNDFQSVAFDSQRAIQKGNEILALANPILAQFVPEGVIVQQRPVGVIMPAKLPVAEAALIAPAQPQLAVRTPVPTTTNSGDVFSYASTPKTLAGVVVPQLNANGNNNQVYIGVYDPGAGAGHKLSYLLTSNLHPFGQAERNGEVFSALKRVIGGYSPPDFIEISPDGHYFIFAVDPLSARSILSRDVSSIPAAGDTTLTFFDPNLSKYAVSPALTVEAKRDLYNAQMQGTREIADIGNNAIYELGTAGPARQAGTVGGMNPLKYVSYQMEQPSPNIALMVTAMNQLARIPNAGQNQNVQRVLRLFVYRYHQNPNYDRLVTKATAIINQAMRGATEEIENHGNLYGGIDLEKLMLQTKGSGVRTAFSDPRILKMLLDAQGLFPQIKSIEPVTVPMANMLLGFNGDQPANDNDPASVPANDNSPKNSYQNAAFIDQREILKA